MTAAREIGVGLIGYAFMGKAHSERPGGHVSVDDAFGATIDFANGAVGTLEASRVATGNKNSLQLEINGSEGSLRFNLERLNELEVFSQASHGFTRILMTEQEHPFMQYWWPTGHIISWEHTFVHGFAHLFNAIAGRGSVAPYGATFEDGYRAAVVCDAIARSAREGGTVSIEY